MSPMMQIIAAVLCACLQEQPDPLRRAQELIEKFRSDEVRVRDEATAELKKLGEPARPLLEKAAADKDKEVAGRARDLLQFLDHQAVAAKHPWGGASSLARSPS